MSARRFAREQWPDQESELAWLRDRGVRIDEKGRIIITLPAPDGDLTASGRDELVSIIELMRREVDRRDGGSRGRRRRGAPKASHRAKPAPSPTPIQPSRFGRPPIGDELRVDVQTTIAAQTRRVLSKRGLSLADVLADCARELADDV
jgi:hypothetical protein